MRATIGAAGRITAGAEVDVELRDRGIEIEPTNARMRLAAKVAPEYLRVRFPPPLLTRSDAGDSALLDQELGVDYRLLDDA